MATLAVADQVTPIEAAKRFGNKDSITVIEEMSKVDEILADAAIYPASDGTVNRTTVRTSQPSGTRRMYNEGIAKHSSKTKQLEDYVSMLEDYSVVDADLADHQPSTKEFLRSEDDAFLAGLALTQAEDFVYGNHTADLAQINGLAIRVPKLVTGGYVVQPATPNATALESTSVYLIKWGRKTTHLFYPQGAEGMGIKRQFRGLVDETDSNGKKYPAYVTFFACQFGLTVKDRRSVGRIANCKTGGTSGVPDGLEILSKVIELRNKMPAGEGNIAIYCNSTIKTAFDIYALTKANMCYYTDDPWGKKVTMFQDMRIRQVESILNTEAIITT